MSAAQVMRNQAAVAPKVDLSEYADQWVLLSNGVVIASDPNPGVVMESASSQGDQVLLHVPKVVVGASSVF